MKTRTIRQHLVPALFTCGMLSLTTGIVAATVQGNDPNTHSENPPAAPTAPASNQTQTADPAHDKTTTEPITFPDTEPRRIILDETGEAYYNYLR